MIIFMVAVVSAYFGWVLAAYPQTVEPVCYTAAETRDKIVKQDLFEPFRAIRNAEGRLQAEMIAIKLCRRSEALVYELSLLGRDGRVIRLTIDAKTGQSLGQRNDRKE